MISSNSKFSRVASQINALAKNKSQFLQALSASRYLSQFLTRTRWSENSLTKPKNKKLKISIVLFSLFTAQNSFAYVANYCVFDSPLQISLGQVFKCGNYYVKVLTLGNQYFSQGRGDSYDTVSFSNDPSGNYLVLQDYIGNSSTGYQQYNQKSGTCSIETQCPAGSSLVSGVCKFSTLSDYFNDPAGCEKAGGYYYSSGVVQSGPTTYKIPMLFGTSAYLKSNYTMETHCGTFTDMLGGVASNVIPMLSLAHPWFKSLRLFKFASYAREAFMRTKPDTTTALSDLIISLPKLPAPASLSMKSVVPIVEKPIPKVADSAGTPRPTREPETIPDEKYQYIADEYIPETTAGDPIVDYSTVDRFNTLAKATSVETPLTELIPEVGTSTLPVKETFDFSKIIQNSEIPADVASVPATTSKTVSYEGADPVDTYVTSKNYPDGSSLLQTVKINRATKQGYVSSTTLASTGESSSLHFPINVPTYNGVLSKSDIIKAPINQTFNSVTATSSPLEPTAQPNSPHFSHFW